MGAQGRLARLRQEACRQGWDAYLARDTSDIRWLTGFDGVFDDEQAHALYVGSERAVLHTDSRYASACRQAAEGGPVEVDDGVTSHADFAAQLAGRDARLALDERMCLGEFRRLEKALGKEGACAPVETEGVVVRLRAVKDEDELARLRAAQAITDATFERIVSIMRPGMTEREVQLELDGLMLRGGAEGLAFATIVATGANGANPHAVPGDARLEAGQCVVMDFGARAQGYCSDMTRTVFLGAPEGEMLAAWEALREANERAEAFVRPGVTGRECHELAERVLEERGFGGRMGHGLGHGVGIDIHELPVLSRRNDQPLEVGNVVTVEPGIYLPGRFGMRLEDCGVVTEKGFEPFGRSTHEPVVI